MSRYAFKVPDLGEGTVTSEIVAWRVAVGDVVQEDAPLAELSTDKAVVEVSSPVTGRVVALAGQPGDTVAVGSELVVFETEAEGQPEPVGASLLATDRQQAASHKAPATPSPTPAAARTGRVMASPATRRRAKEAGLDLATVAGSGPGGRIEKRDLEAALGSSLQAPVGAGLPATSPPPVGAGLPATGLASPRTAIEEIKVIGVRRVIAQRMAEAKRTIPHFSYVEEVDVTALEALRVHLNKSRPRDEAYTYLPFVIAALVRVLPQFPQCNAHYDAERNVLLRHAGVHVGVATQTPDGLKVPVVRHAEARTLSGLAAEVRRVSGAARNNTAKREELSGSTITVTSLGKLGGIVSTPVINLPEVAIIGLNKAVERPMVVDGAVVVRRMMNLSSSFDHRFVDGFDAAAMVQALKERLENPATIFMAD
jgi:2-oxoisovalerate dehydrogenase E2 component (dihydrolipoyl transacylase)